MYQIRHKIHKGVLFSRLSFFYDDMAVLILMKHMRVASCQQGVCHYKRLKLTIHCLPHSHSSFPQCSVGNQKKPRDNLLPQGFLVLFFSYSEADD